MDLSLPSSDLSLTDLCTNFVRVRSRRREGRDARDDDVPHNALLALETALGALTDGEKHAEGDGVLSSEALGEALRIGVGVEARQRQCCAVRAADGGDGRGVVVENVAGVLRREFCKVKER